MRGRRLVNKHDFDRALTRRSVVRRAGPCRLYAVANGRPSARLGLIIPKRRVARAVRRNHLKRLIRESFRLAVHRLPAVDVVVQLTGEPTDEELRDILAYFWNELASEAGDEPEQ